MENNNVAKEVCIVSDFLTIFSFHFSEDLFEGFEKAYLNLNGTKGFFF